MSDAAQNAPSGHVFSSLRVRNYSIWWISAWIANIGTWLQRIAQDWLVLTELTHNSGTALGVVTALQFAPILFMAPLAGLITDRYSLRKILFMTQAAMAVLAVVQGVLVIFGVMTIGGIMILALVVGIVTAIDSTARQTFVSELVGPRLLPNAVSLNSLSFNGARLIGPAVSGFLIGIIGTGWVFILNGVSFVATLVAISMIRDRELIHLPSVPKAKGQTREGLSYIAHRPDITLILIVIFVVASLGLNYQVTSALMATEVYHRGAQDYGLLGTAAAVGSVVGALLAARREKPSLNLILTGALSFGIVNVLGAFMPTYILFAAASVLIGLATMTLTTSANAGVQMATAPRMRGRVMAVYNAVFMGTTLFGSPLIGWIGEVAGARWSVFTGGAASVIAAGGALLYVRKHREVGRMLGEYISSNRPATGTISVVDREEVRTGAVPTIENEAVVADAAAALGDAAEVEELSGTAEEEWLRRSEARKASTKDDAARERTAAASEPERTREADADGHRADSEESENGTPPVPADESDAPASPTAEDTEQHDRRADEPPDAHPENDPADRGTGPAA